MPVQHTSCAGSSCNQRDAHLAVMYFSLVARSLLEFGFRYDGGTWYSRSCELRSSLPCEDVNAKRLSSDHLSLYQPCMNDMWQPRFLQFSVSTIRGIRGCARKSLHLCAPQQSSQINTRCVKEAHFISLAPQSAHTDLPAKSLFL